MQFRVLPGAQRDLNEIFVYWAERAGLSISDRLIESITERFWLLGQFPKIGKTATDVARGVRFFPAGEYLIYYRVSRRTIDVLHVFHGARDQNRAFRARKKRS